MTGHRSEKVLARNNQYAKSCGNKKQFFTERDCEKAIYYVTKVHKDVGLVAYKCHFCGWWHFGHEIGIERKVQSDGGNHDTSSTTV